MRGAVTYALKPQVEQGKKGTAEYVIFRRFLYCITRVCYIAFSPVFANKVNT